MVDRGNDAPIDGHAAVPRHRRRRSALLWGAVGALSFLVVAQGYLLLDGELPLGYAGLFPVAAAVGGILAATAYLFEHRLRRRGL